MPKVRRSSISEHLKPDVKIVIAGCKDSGNCGILHWLKVNRVMTVEELLKSVKAITKHEGCFYAMTNLLSKFELPMDTVLDYDKWDEIRQKIAEGDSRTGYWQDDGFNRKGYNPFEQYDPMSEMRNWPYGTKAKNRADDYYYPDPKRWSGNRFKEKWSISATLLFSDEPDFAEL